MGLFNWSSKNTKNETKADNYDDFDLGDLDDVFGESKSKGFKGDVKDGVIDGIISNVKDISNVRKDVSTLLPSGYSMLLDRANSLISGINDITEAAKEEFKPLKPMARRNKDRLKKILPKKVYEKLESSLDENTYGSFQRDDDALAEASIQKTLNDLFGQADKAANSVQSESDRKRSIGNSKAVGSLALDAHKLVAFNEYQTINFQRKMVELAARTYQINVKMFAANVKASARKISVLEKIAANTAMPDFAKESYMNTWRKNMRTNIMDSFSKNIFNSKDFFGKNLLDSFKSTAKDTLGGFVGNLTSLEDGLSSVDGMGMSRGNAIGLGIGSMATEKLRERLMTMLKERAEKSDGRLGRINKSVKSTGKRLENELNEQIDNIIYNARRGKEYSSKDAMNVFRRTIGLDEKELTGEEGNLLTKTLSEFFNNAALNANKSSKSLILNKSEDLGNTTAFTVQTHRSINTVIPQLLGKILRENVIIRTNLGFSGEGVPEIAYDWKANKFSTEEQIIKKAREATFRASDARWLKDDLDKVTSHIEGFDSEKDGKLTDAMNLALLKGRGSYKTLEKAITSTDPKSPEGKELRKLLSYKGTDKDHIYQEARSKFNKVKSHVNSLVEPQKYIEFGQEHLAEQILGSDPRNSIDNFEEMSQSYLVNNQFNENGLSKEERREQEELLKNLLDTKKKQKLGTKLAGYIRGAVDTGLDKLHLGKSSEDTGGSSEKDLNKRIANVRSLLAQDDSIIKMQRESQGGGIGNNDPYAFLQPNKQNIKQPFISVASGNTTTNTNSVDVSSFENTIRVLSDNISKLTTIIPNQDNEYSEEDNTHVSSIDTKMDSVIDSIANLGEVFKEASAKGAFVAYSASNPEADEKMADGYIRSIFGNFGVGAKKALGGIGSLGIGIGKGLFGLSKGALTLGFPLAGKLHGRLKTGIDNLFGKYDVYIKGQEDPVLTYTKMKGDKYYYLDKSGKQVVFNDIKNLSKAYKESSDGMFYDLDTGSVVVKISDLTDALQNKLLFIKHRGIFENAGNLIKGITKNILTVGSLSLRGGLFGLNKIGKLASNLFKNLTSGAQDVYIRGISSPVLQKSLMLKGAYYLESTGKPFYDATEIDGPVLDKDGNYLITAEQVKTGLVDKYGRNLTKGWGRVKNFAMDKVNKVGGLISLGWKKLKGIGGSIGRGIKRMFNIPGGFKTASANGYMSGEDAQNVTANTLLNIYALLDDRLPLSKKKRRDALKEEQEKRKGNNIGPDGTSDDSSDEKSGFFGKLFGGLKGLGGKIKGLFADPDAKKDEDGNILSDAADISEVGRGLKGVAKSMGRGIKGAGRGLGKLLSKSGIPGAGLALKGAGLAGKAGAGTWKYGGKALKGFAKVMGGGKMIPAIGTAIGAGLAIKSALDGNYADAFESGASTVGGILGAALGPLGALVGAGIGWGVGKIGTGLYRKLTEGNLDAEAGLRYLAYGWKFGKTRMKSVITKGLALATFGMSLVADKLLSKKLEGKYAPEIFKLERIMMSYVRPLNNGKVDIDTKITDKDNEEVKNIFDIDPTDSESVMYFATWIKSRFLPVFKAHIEARMKSQEKVDFSKELSLLEIEKYCNEFEVDRDALLITTPPNPKWDECTPNIEEMAKFKKDILEKCQKELSGYEKDEFEAVTDEQKSAVKKRKEDRAKGIAVGGFKVNEKLLKEEEEGLKSGKLKVNDLGIVVYAQTGLSFYDMKGFNQIDEMRCYCYGIANYETNKKRIQILESKASKCIELTNNSFSIKELDNKELRALLSEYAITFEGDKDKNARDEFMNWFIYRVIYTLGNTVLFINQVKPGAVKRIGDLPFALRQLSMAERYKVAQQMMTLLVEVDKVKVSIWDINCKNITSPKAKENANDVLAGLKAVAEKDPKFNEMNSKALNQTSSAKGGTIESNPLATTEEKQKLSGKGLNSSVIGKESDEINSIGKSVYVADSIQAKREMRFDEVTIVRLKTYGFKEVTLNYTAIMYKLERIIGQHIKIDGSGIVTLDRAEEDLLELAKPMLLMSDKSNNSASMDTGLWFITRFLPTFCTYVSGVFRITGKRIDKFPPEDEGSLTYNNKLQLCDAISRAEYSVNGTWVWKINKAPFKLEANMDPNTIYDNMEYLKQEAEKETKDIAVAERKAKTEANNANGPKTAEERSNEANSWKPTRSDDTTSPYSSSPSTSYAANDSSFSSSTSSATSSDSIANNPSSNASYVIDKVGSGRSGTQFSMDSVNAAQLLINTAIKHGITDTNELMCLVGQCWHETGGFKRVDENLNYRPQTLMKLFPNRFSDMAKAQCVADGGPVAIANSLYGGRMGNNEPGDGWKYRGRGFIQVTGKENYKIAGQKVGMDFLSNPDIIQKNPEAAAEITVGWWLNNRKRLAPLAKNMDLKGLRRVTNGGSIGLQGSIDATKLVGSLIKQGKLNLNGAPIDPNTLKPEKEASSTTPQAGAGPRGNLINNISGEDINKESSGQIQNSFGNNGIDTEISNKVNNPSVAANDSNIGADTTESIDNSCKVPAGSMPDKAADMCRRAAGGKSVGKCAKYVRMALQKAGYDIVPQASAYMYAHGPLEQAGFSKIPPGSPASKGDIIVWDRSNASPHGHIQIFDGKNWVSDFVQNQRVPGQKYRGCKFTMWRDTGASSKGGSTVDANKPMGAMTLVSESDQAMEKETPFIPQANQIDTAARNAQAMVNASTAQATSNEQSQQAGDNTNAIIIEMLNVHRKNLEVNMDIRTINQNQLERLDTLVKTVGSGMIGSKDPNNTEHKQKPSNVNVKQANPVIDMTPKRKYSAA